jgi:hypothetical protein
MKILVLLETFWRRAEVSRKNPFAVSLQKDIRITEAA